MTCNQIVFVGSWISLTILTIFWQSNKVQNLLNCTRSICYDYTCNLISQECLAFILSDFGWIHQKHKLWFSIACKINDTHAFLPYPDTKGRKMKMELTCYEVTVGSRIRFSAGTEYSIFIREAESIIFTRVINITCCYFVLTLASYKIFSK